MVREIYSLSQRGFAPVSIRMVMSLCSWVVERECILLFYTLAPFIFSHYLTLSVLRLRHRVSLIFLCFAAPFVFVLLDRLIDFTFRESVYSSTIIDRVVLQEPLK
ncbi:hypothetical protein P691DRAFT_155204 [Macrolepiota fuliginosa MF-IS2]|uniref:Uncharacterized protein n=1 Tax=Macrolepiota fuliginosa MF-IS2 TaxID=1400762 RepID=A0A9P5XCS3_9AGAR|nr:hypothetical protein P691DRAFT_155204 [Macrolepiota fuliginosa MF-IS2]